MFSEFDTVTVVGTGRYGSVSDCRGPLTIVYETQHEAEVAKASIDRIGCGNRCTRHHDLWLAIDEMAARATSSRGRVDLGSRLSQRRPIRSDYRLTVTVSHGRIPPTGRGNPSRPRWEGATMANAEIEDRDWFQLHAEWADWDVEEDPGFAPEAVALMREVRPVTEEETNPNLTAAAYRLLRKLMRVQDIVLGVPGSFKRA